MVLPQNDETHTFLAKLETELADSIVKARAQNSGKKVKVAGLSIRTEAEEGTVHFDFRLMAKVNPKEGQPYTQKPALFDAACNQTQNRINDGSIIKLSFLPIPYYTQTTGAGITLRLQAVQVISWAGDTNDGRSFGFKREFGYEEDGGI